MTNEIREWLTLALTAVVAAATATTAIFIWRDRKQPIIFNAHKEKDGRLNCRLEFRNTAPHKVVMELLSVTRPRGARVYERNREAGDNPAILTINREIEPDAGAAIVFYVESASIIREFRAKLSVSRRLRAMRISRYAIKRSITD